MLSIFRISVNIKESEGDNKEDGPASSLASQPIEANSQDGQPNSKPSQPSQAMKAKEKPKVNNVAKQGMSKTKKGAKNRKGSKSKRKLDSLNVLSKIIHKVPGFSIARETIKRILR